MKVCRECGRLLPRDAFYRERRNVDGLRGNCIECHRARARDYWRTERGRATWARKVARDSAAGKLQARNTARNAVRAGKLQRQPCEICGRLDVHAHHEDYSRPLDVRWLCSEHHGIEHRQYD